MEIKIETLCLEVTRRCNMSCAHCMRGDAENLDADSSLIPRIFDGVTEIDSIVFTGGEPSLNTDYITAVIDYIIDHNISVHGCFIATNAKIYSQSLVDNIRRLYEADYENKDRLWNGAKWLKAHRDYDDFQVFALAVSSDEYHDPVPAGNLLRYYKCGFFSEEKMTTDGPLLARGRGASFPGAYDRGIREPFIELVGEQSLHIGMAYVSCTGTVVTDCDLPYYDIDLMQEGDPGYLCTINKSTSLCSALTGALAAV